MKRKAQFYYAGHGGRPIYVHGFLTDERSDGTTGPLVFEVIGSEPEPRPTPGRYAASDLPGGWMALMPSQEGDQSSGTGDIEAARAAGFPVRAEYR